MSLSFDKWHTYSINMEIVQTTSKDIIARIKQQDLKNVLTYLVDKCNGVVELYSDGGEDSYSDITIYSEYFKKQHLDVIFNYCFYSKEIVYCPKMKMMRMGMELELN